MGSQRVRHDWVAFTFFSLPGSSVHGIPQAGILEWVVISFSRGSSQPRDRTQVLSSSCIGRQILYCWATRLRGQSDITWWEMHDRKWPKRAVGRLQAWRRASLLRARTIIIFLISVLTFFLKLQSNLTSLFHSSFTHTIGVIITSTLQNYSLNIHQGFWLVPDTTSV